MKVKKKRLLKKKRRVAKRPKKIWVRKKKKKLIKKSRSKKLKKIFLKKKRRKKSVRKVRKTKILKPKQPSFPVESFFKTKIKVIGIGGGGSSIVSEISRSLHKATFVIADSDARAFKRRRGIKYFLFGKNLTHGLGTGLNQSLGKMAAEQGKERLARLFKDQHIVIFIASLGGGLGSGATPVFVEKINENFEGISFGIFTLPFKFEGQQKQAIASRALAQLRKKLNVSIVIPNERVFRVINPDTPITQAFSKVNKTLIESLESLIDMIYNPGVINIDFADLRAILKGKGDLAFLNTVESSGKDRLKKITQQVLHNPLYRKSHFVAQRVLFNIQGGNDLSMFEVDKISKIIAEQSPKAKIIFGISKNSKYKNKIKATVLMTGEPTTSPKVLAVKPLKLSKKTGKKIKKVKKKFSITPVSINRRKILLKEQLVSVFNKAPLELDLKRLSVVEKPKSQSLTLKGLIGQEIVTAASRPFQSSTSRTQSKKAIRRTALEIKKAQEMEEKRRAQQEKEWEIPAFLRKVKFKP